MSKGGRYSKQNQSRDRGRGHSRERKNPVLTVLILLVVILVLAVAVLVGMMVYQSFMEQGSLREPIMPSIAQTEWLEETEAVVEETTEEPTTIPTTLPYTESGKDIINILMIGDSARKGETNENYHLADTMMLATVNKKTKTLTLTSFLRDTYVQLPAYKTPSGKNKINVAYHLGYLWGDSGGAMIKINECIKENFGIEVDHNVEVDFEAFIDIVYELGGINVELTQAEANYLNKDKSVEESDYTAGWTWLGGPEALSYARMRKADGDGDSDIKRTARQRTVITELVKQVKGMSIEQAQNLLEVILPAVTTNMTNEEIKTCMWEILPILGDLKIESGTAPVQGSYWSKDIGTEDVPSYALEYDKGQNIKHFQAIAEGIIPEEPKKTN